MGLGLRSVDPYPFYGYGTGIYGSPVPYPFRRVDAFSPIRPAPPIASRSDPKTEVTQKPCRGLAAGRLTAGHVPVIIPSVTATFAAWYLRAQLDDFSQPVKAVYGRVRVTHLRVHPYRTRPVKSQVERAYGRVPYPGIVNLTPTRAKAGEEDLSTNGVRFRPKSSAEGEQRQTLATSAEFNWTTQQLLHPKWKNEWEFDGTALSEQPKAVQIELKSRSDGTKMAKGDRAKQSPMNWDTRMIFCTTWVSGGLYLHGLGFKWEPPACRALPSECEIGADGSDGSGDPGHARCIVNTSRYRYDGRIYPKIGGKEFRAIRYQWPDGFTAPCSHVVMSELKTVIKLHDIRITSLTNPHDDLPGDMKMFAQLIIDGNIFLQTVLMALEQDQMTWKLSLGCNIPPHACTFSVTALRHSKTEGIRLLGHTEITREEILRSTESNLSFELELNKVNPDGPSLKLSVGCSVSEVLYQKIPGVNPINMPENTSDIIYPMYYQTI
ncbi:hypothetical protein K438DRAFT_1938974 [Mycena galopus ATCC 62051]|nr:hypothetical protein K438DRAFT_1938974 [Mycena galopus ATCC 62051]